MTFVARGDSRKKTLTKLLTNAGKDSNYKLKEAILVHALSLQLQLVLLATMINLFPATGTDPVPVASSSSSKKNDNDDQLKNSIKDHFNDTKTVRRRGSRTRKQLIATPVEPTIDESFADDSTVAVEYDSTFDPSAAGIVATDDEITLNLKIPSPHPYAQTAMLPPSILRQQPHFGTVSPPLPPGTVAFNNDINMMPPPHPAYSYYNCYDYSCNSASSTRGGGHPYIKNVEVLGGDTGAGGCDYSYCSGMDSSSYCTTPSLLLTEPCEGFAKLVLRTVNTFASSVVRVMDYGEELCDSSSGNNNNNINTNNSSNSIGTGGPRSTMSNEYVDLLAKIERLQKMVTEKETVFVATEKEEDGAAPSTPNGSTKIINDLTESPITKEAEENEDTKTMNTPAIINDDAVYDMLSSSNPRSRSNVPVVQITSSRDWSVLNEPLTVLNESIETDLYDFKDVVYPLDNSQAITVGGDDDRVFVKKSTFLFSDTTMTTSNTCKPIEVEEQMEEFKQLNRSKGSKLKKFFHPKLLVNTGAGDEYSTLLEDQPAVDSMGFLLDDEFSSLLPKSSDNALSSWGCDFNSSINPFKRMSSVCSAESSPVSVATTLESNSCANCGLDGKVYKSKKKNLMICSQCQSTYYCSSECQSEDWSNGHFKTCQSQPLASAAVDEVLL